MNILIAGDYYPNRRVKHNLERCKHYIISEEIVEMIKSADLSIVNYESPITEGTKSSPIKKSGPVLCSDKKAADYIKTVGFNLATLANNHTSDYGGSGLLNTVSVLKEKGVSIVGAGENLQDAGKIYYHKNEVAIINCCEHEFGIADESNPGANPLNPVLQYYQIAEARNNAKFVIVIVHGGCEYFQYPTPRMKELYRFYIDVGADAVVNAHQHCFSGYEKYKDKVIFYGLGNFCFDSSTPEREPSSWNYGYMVVLRLSDIVDFDILPYCQCAQEPTVELLKGKERSEFLYELERMNSVITDPNKLMAIYKQWIEDNDAVYRYLAKPFNTRRRFLPWLKGIITIYLNKEIKELILNCIRCESHRDRLISLFEQ